MRIRQMMIASLAVALLASMTVTLAAEEPEVADAAHSRNANFLLNVGPDRDGRIIPDSVKTLAEIGALRQE